MKAKDIVKGAHYIAKVSGRETTVRVDSIDERPASSYATTLGTRSKSRATTRYHCTNLATGRQLVFRSASKFRGVANVATETTFFNRVCTCHVGTGAVCAVHGTLDKAELRKGHKVRRPNESEAAS